MGYLGVTSGVHNLVCGDGGDLGRIGPIGTEEKGVDLFISNSRKGVKVSIYSLLVFVFSVFWIGLRWD